MAKGTFLVLSIVSVLTTYAQTALPSLTNLKTTKEKIETLKEFSREMAGTRDFDALIKGTDAGISLSGNNNSYLCFFTFYKGYAFEQKGETDSAVNYIKQSEVYARKDGDLQGVAEAMQELHYIYFYGGRGTERVPLMDKAEQMLDTISNSKAKAILISMLSEYYYDQSKYEKAITYKLKFIEVQKSSSEKLDVVSLNNIGVVYVQVAETYSIMSQPVKALEYLREAAPYFKDFYTGEANLLNNFISNFLILNKPDSATVYYDYLYRSIKTGDTLFEYLSYANRSFAEFYVDQRKFKQALQYALKGFMLSQQSKQPISVLGAHGTLGKVYYEMGNFQQALFHLKAIQEDANAFGPETYAATQELLAKTNAGLGNWQQAYHYYNRYSSLHDSLLKETTNKNIANAEAKFQNKEKQDKIILQSLQLSKAYTERAWLIAGIVLIVLTALLLYIIYRNKKHTAQVLDGKNKVLAQLITALEEANTTKAKLFGIIGHDLRSPINRVYQFLKLQQLNPQLLSEQQQEELSTKIQNATGSLLETMEDLLLWSKTQLKEFAVTVQMVNIPTELRQCIELLQLNIEAKKLIIENTLPDEMTLSSDPYMFQVIVRNLLQNSIKAAPENSTIHITISIIGTHTVLSIQNEGGSFSQQDYLSSLQGTSDGKNMNGLGLQIVNELSGKINAQVYFEALPSGGTSVQLSLRGIQ